MLAKLLKYEFKATARLFIPLYIALITFTLINRVVNTVESVQKAIGINIKTILSVISMVGYVVLIISISAITLIIMVQRFYKNLLGDEGYLMFTLPVKTWQNVLNKLIFAVFWTISSGLVTIASIIIISEMKDVSEILIEICNKINSFFGIAGFVSLPLVFILGISSNILMFYSAITLGHQFTRHKLIASLGMYCVVYFINSFILGILLLMLRYIPAVHDILEYLFNYSTSMHFKTNIIVLLISIYPIISLIGQFVLMNFLLKKRLNLE
jgi:hypothetical protein